MMTEHFLCFVLLFGLITFAASKEYYIIRPSQSHSCDGHAECGMDVSDFTLSQFINNSSDYLTNDTTLIFSPGSHSLESELAVENVHSFSMFVWPGSSSKAVINCHGHNARFEFSDVSTVTVSGLEFVGCFENHVMSVGHFQLENSGFFGNGQAKVNGTVLSIEESTGNLDRVVFIVLSAETVDEPLIILQDLLNNYYLPNCTVLDQIFSAVDVISIGISSRSSNISIKDSLFEGNNVGFIRAVIYDEFGSNIVIINTTFVNNSASASNLYAQYRCYGDRNITSSIVHTSGHGSTVKIYDSNFGENEGVIISGENCDMLITHTRFMNNMNGEYIDTLFHICDAKLAITHSTFTNNTVHYGSHYESRVLDVRNTNMSISHSEFISNHYGSGNMIHVSGGLITSIDHSKFISNTGGGVLYVGTLLMSYTENTAHMDTKISQCEFIDNEILQDHHYPFISALIDTISMTTISIDQCKFTNNTVHIVSGSVIRGGITLLHLNEFINNTAETAVVYILYQTTAENLTGNVFTDNSAAYEVYIGPLCRPGLSLSLGSYRCIKCSDHWRRDLIGIVVAAFIAGIALVIFMLALNMTVAIGTLNGILFYANIVAANADTHFPNFVSAHVFISWLNLDIGFDICFNDEYEYLNVFFKALLQLAFPVYVIVLVIIVIVASQCSSKFAKIIGKGNPVAVLATMILLSYTKFLSTIFLSLSLLLSYPSLGSRNLNPSKSGLVQDDDQTKAIAISVAITIPLLCIIFSLLVFSWQWLLRYQNKAIFKWVRYQKLCHFLEPYHAPYTAKYRYWTGLLLFVRALLYLISILNFSLDPRVDLMATIFIVGGLILLKGVTAKRIYKNWPLDVMETAIYFNLVAFSALTWYSLDFGGNQVAVAYTSVMIIFILLLGVIVFHVLRYTRLYKCSFVEKTFKWTSSKLLEKKPKEHPTNDAPEELDGYRLERSAPGDQELPTVTYSVIEINQPAVQNQEEKYTEG